MIKKIMQLPVQLRMSITRDQKKGDDTRFKSPQSLVESRFTSVTIEVPSSGVATKTPMDFFVNIFSKGLTIRSAVKKFSMQNKMDSTFVLDNA